MVDTTTRGLSVLQRGSPLYLGVPENEAISDPELAEVRRQWALATADVCLYHARLCDCAPLAGDVEYLKEPSVPGTLAPAPAASKRISEWRNNFLIEKAKSRSSIRENTESSYREYIAEFLFVIGDLPVRSVTAKHAEEFRDKLQRIPKNRNKRFAGKNLDELLRLNLPPKECRAGRTINEHLGLMRGMFK